MRTQNLIVAGVASLLCTSTALATSITSEQFQAMYTGSVMAMYGQGSVNFQDGTSSLPSAGGAPAATDLGTLNGDSSIGGSLLPNEVQWFSFMLDGATYLDIVSSATFDTEIGLFSDLGALLGNDDDDGFSTGSFLSFGAGTGALLGGAGVTDFADTISDGRDGPLAAGLYYLAIGEFNVNFGDGFFADSTGPDVGGTFTIDFYTDSSTPISVPEPMSLLLIGCGLIGLAARRRRS